MNMYPKRIMVTYAPLSTSQGPVRRSKWSQFIFILLCFSFPVTIIFLDSLLSSVRPNDEVVHEVLNAAAEDPTFADRYRHEDIKTSDIKYILLWTRKDFSPLDYLGKGPDSFIKNKCTFTNCFVTSNKGLFGGDITKFDAIVFNGRNLKYTLESGLPQVRSSHQKYIFVNLESSDNQPICEPWFNGFFNWTCTYKLNSDIVYSYIYIRDKTGKPVGPKINMEWVNWVDMDEVDEKFKAKLKSKRIAAAWFASHCRTRSKRQAYVKKLQVALKPHRLTVDVYGRCGALVCPRANETVCYSKVESDYYFYLSFENSIAEDYITEKLLTAFNHDAVPIVYGGSDYSRFLPPGSYIDAREYKPDVLAGMMADIIANPPKYHEFFRWRNHYSYSESERVEDVCNVCAALNNRNKLAKSVYEDFRSWWNPDWQERCKDKAWNS